jgi:aminomethyltransferase
MLKRTPLYEQHLALKAKLIDFGGWEMPVQYSGLVPEHNAVRSGVGLFDVSHMGEFSVSGPGALEFTNSLVTNDVATLVIGQALYTVMCREDGTIVDDLVIYRTGEKEYLWVVNASNIEKDFSFVSQAHDNYSNTKPTLTNRSSEYFQVALQGPKAAAVLQTLTSTDLSAIKTYYCAQGEVAGANCLIARTGYTGEDGFEIYGSPADAAHVWNALLKAGEPHAILPCGLGARDTLRTEMKYPLYGHEINDETHPLETGLGWVVKLGKQSFSGKRALESAKVSGIKRALIGLRGEGRIIARQGYKVLNEAGNEVGIVTSGTLSPSLGFPIAIALIDKTFSEKGATLLIQVRDQKVPFQICETPFLKLRSK